jgi:hypothetical protein
MSSAAVATAQNSRWLPLRFAWRELRGGLHGFYVFVVCIALGSMAIAGVGSVAASLADGLARQGQVILGGDLSFTLVQREATPPELAFLQSRGKISSAATLRAMARTAGQATLVEMKAVDAAYPLFGRVVLDPPGPLSAALVQRDGAYGAVADPTLMTRRAQKRAGQARRRHRFRAALDGERGRPARRRIAAAGQPGALALPLAVAGERHDRRRRQHCDDAGARAIPAGRLGHPHPLESLAAARAQRRALHAISHHRRPDRAAGRRRRRRQRS